MSLLRKMLIPEKDFDLFNPHADVGMSRSNLPHWRQNRCLYFLTFRLYDSIPGQKLSNWKIEYHNWLERNRKPWSNKQLDEYLEHFARKIEHWLDQAHGSCLLASPACKEAVSNTMKRFDGARYKLDSYTIASNHVHALVVPFADYALSAILKGWKGVSAREVNKLLNRKGSVWQKESYDHIVRNAQSLERIRNYIQRHESPKP